MQSLQLQWGAAAAWLRQRQAGSELAAAVGVVRPRALGVEAAVRPSLLCELALLQLMWQQSSRSLE